MKDTRSAALAAADTLMLASAAGLNRTTSALVRQAFDNPVARMLAAHKPPAGETHPALDPMNALATIQKEK